ncbi:D-alanyl-D-alanine carboxypeptidase [Streptomyces sp. NPDC102490]|uniref:D-alanyl-D-alanine carboxypeptidase n=1 Tax=Streptomyces sp. NPDC102490 TaxID=3366183 RepID=UPI0038184703
MEEASVAGEFPDRSKQRESSEEPTSGSAGPVPEARTEASERSDPRLPVAREDAKRSAGSGGVETATRVLSVREAEAGASGGDDGAGSAEAADTSSDPSGAPETAEEAEGDGVRPAPGNDGRLRDAVAAWVATADERAAANARLEDGRAPEEPSQDDDEPGAEQTAEGAKDAPQADEQPEAADGTADSDGDTATASGAAPDTDAAPGTASGTGTASGSGSAPGSDADAGAGTDAGTGKGAGTDAGTGKGAGTEEASDSDPVSDSGTDTDSGTGPDPKPLAEADPEAGAGAGRDDSDGDTDGDGDGAVPVDQPTAVFKAPRPAVDQPTTMLKLGGAAAGAKKAGPGDDAERTSKFVALRNPDEPATRKPPPGQAPSADAPKASRTGATSAVPHVGPDRTTQQPLPPKPPLDLLAELTNTPPPPETPLRTTVRRVKIWTPLVILLLIVFGVVQSMRPLPAPTLDLTAQDSFTFDGGKPEIPWPSSGQAALDVQGIGSFGSSGDQKPVPIASVAKVMTAYVILRDHPLKSGAEGPKIKIDGAAEQQSEAGDESTVHVYEGDAISQREALKAILIASANNVARLLARWDAGSEKAFVEKMNAAAKDLGMTNSTYTDPSGLNNTTVSTAVDQVKLAKEAMKEPAFREVAAMMSYDDYKGVNHSNWNHLVGHNDVVGIKTGTTTSALGNLVFAAKKEVGGETRTIVGAVVRQPAGGADNTILGAALDSSDKLIRAAQDTLKSSTILKKGTVVGYVDDGLGGRTPVVAAQDVKAVGWAGLTVKLTFKADEVPHTAKAGTKVGTLTVGDGGTSGAVKVPVALRDDLVEPGLSDKLTRVG